MGLSIYWEFGAEVDAAGAARLVEAMRTAAEGLFTEVGQVVEVWADRAVAGTGMGGAEGKAGASEEEAERAAADRGWAMSQGLISLPEEVVAGPAGGGVQVTTRRVAPGHVVLFRAYNEGADDAVFGLAAYAGLPGYRWTAGCVTQGAAKRAPRGGVGGAAGSAAGGVRTAGGTGGVGALDGGGGAGGGGGNALVSFLRAHRAVIAVLDKARGLGVKVRARDDGEYWEKRDQKVLIDKLAEWEVLMASIRAKRPERGPCPKLAAEMRPKIEAARKLRPRLDRDPVEGLEG